MNLFVRLSLVFLATLLILGTFSLWIAERSARSYFLEFTQRLNAPIAMYMAQNAGLASNGVVNAEALNALAEHVMMINPSIEVYVLDLHGHVIAQAANANIIAQPSVSMTPIQQALHQIDRDGFGSDSGSGDDVIDASGFSNILLGDNPLDTNDKRPFSAYPLSSEGKQIGYVYALLAGREHQTLLGAIRSSHSLRDLAWILICVIVLAGITGSILFFSLTRRLRRLTRHVQNTMDTAVNSDSITAGLEQQSARWIGTNDEIDELANAYDNMAMKLQSQYECLAEKDRIRRELIANISHDLRTPLTTLQGYLETVLVKRGTVDESVERQYLSIAHKHSMRLRKLVSELFELSKFDSGEFVLDCEVFSIHELAQDALQDLSNIAQQRRIELAVVAKTPDDKQVFVKADIALIHRVLENLLDNALRFTNSGGHIAIEIAQHDSNRICITVIDDGVGMHDADSRLAFEPRFRADTEAKNDNEAGHAGLGLAIVKSIVKLHDGDIDLKTRPGGGARFAFDLAVALPQNVLASVEGAVA